MSFSAASAYLATISKNRAGLRATLYALIGHLQLKHSSKPGRVTVPHPKKDLSLGTMRSIEKQAGLKLKAGK